MSRRGTIHFQFPTSSILAEAACRPAIPRPNWLNFGLRNGPWLWLISTMYAMICRSFFLFQALQHFFLYFFRLKWVFWKYGTSEFDRQSVNHHFPIKLKLHSNISDRPTFCRHTEITHLPKDTIGHSEDVLQAQWVRWSKHTYTVGQWQTYWAYWTGRSNLTTQDMTWLCLCLYYKILIRYWWILT